MSSLIHVVACTNKNYLPGAFVTLGSLLDANDGRDKFVLHVLDTGIGEDGCARLRNFIGVFPNAELRIHAVDTACFKDFPAHFGGDLSTYARLLIGSFVDAPHCICTDVDVLFLKDVAQLWRKGMRRKKKNPNIIRAIRYFGNPANPAGTLDYDCPFMPAEEARKYPYYHAGFFMCDLDAWREFDAERKAFDLLRQAGAKLKLHDQTILNYLLRGRIGNVDPSWCWLANCGPLLTCVVYHYYTDRKPWNRKTFLTANALWHAYYKIRVRPFYRFTRPWKTRLFNIAWEMRTFFFAFFFTEAYLKFRRKRGVHERIIAATRNMFKTYRRWVTFGPDLLSRYELERLSREWRKKNRINSSATIR